MKQHFPQWMTSQDLADQGHGSEDGSRQEERSSPKEFATTSTPVKRSAEREEESRRKVAKIWDVPVADSSSKEFKTKDASPPQTYKPSRMYPGFGPPPPTMMPGQQFLPYPPYPREFLPRVPTSTPVSETTPNTAVPSSSQSSDPDREKLPTQSQNVSKIDLCNVSKTSPHHPVPTSPPKSRAESSLNLPVLKSVLSSPPLSNPALWCADRIVGRRRHSDEDTRPAHPRSRSEDRSHSEDYIRERASDASHLGLYEPQSIHFSFIEPGVF